MTTPLRATYLPVDRPPTSAVSRTMWGIAIIWFGIAVALARLTPEALRG